MDLGLRGRTAVIGGASAGLGLATVQALAAEGCRLYLWARHAESLEQAAVEATRRGAADARYLAADAADPASAAAVAAGALSAYETIDIVVLNQGGPPRTDPRVTTLTGWQEALQLVALTSIDLASRLMLGMATRRWGRVVAILSSGVRTPIPDLVYSNGARSLLAAWLKTTATDAAADGITLNGVLPGRIETQRLAKLDASRAASQGRAAADVRQDGLRAIPMGRYGRPEELAAAVAFLCSERAGYITGTLLPMDGGMLRDLR